MTHGSPRPPPPPPSGSSTRRFGTSLRAHRRLHTHPGHCSSSQRRTRRRPTPHSCPPAVTVTGHDLAPSQGVPEACPRQLLTLRRQALLLRHPRAPWADPRPQRPPSRKTTPPSAASSSPSPQTSAAPWRTYTAWLQQEIDATKADLPHACPSAKPQASLRILPQLSSSPSAMPSPRTSPSTPRSTPAPLSAPSTSATTRTKAWPPRLRLLRRRTARRRHPPQ